MSAPREEIAALRLRIAGAESQRDSWRAAGSQEKYLEAYSLVEALEAQLSSLEEKNRTVAVIAASSNTELCIRYNGRSYHYAGYRYDRFIDAVNYARLDLARGSREAPGGEAAMAHVPLPTEADRALMQALAITFEAGTFRWGEYRYDRLADAVAYATLQARR